MVLLFQGVMIRQKEKEWLLGVGLYSNIKHFKNRFVRNHWTNFSITWQKCTFGDPLSRFGCHDVLKRKKNMAAVGGWWGVGGAML